MSDPSLTFAVSQHKHRPVITGYALELTVRRSSAKSVQSLKLSAKRYKFIIDSVVNRLAENRVANNGPGVRLWSLHCFGASLHYRPLHTYLIASETIDNK